MPDPGHLFVVRGDLARVACDDALVPTDPGRTVTASYAALLPARLLGDAAAGDPAPDGVAADDTVRVAAPDGRVAACGAGRQGARAWLVETAGRADDDGWVVEGVLQWLAEVAEHDEPPRLRRQRRLAALPLVGTGGGPAAGRRGDLLRALLPALADAVRRSPVDVALVLSTESDHAAAQQVRRELDLGAPLPEPQMRHARRLARHAEAGELAVFVGAGVSAMAGMPVWSELVQRLADDAGLPDELRDGIGDLPPQDATSVIARRMGEDRLADRVRELFGPRPHALAHGLLAGLPVRELVTTNVDALLESAMAGAGRDLCVLPGDHPRGDQPWLLKLHGDVTLPGSTVLTREEFLDFDAGRAALAGAVEALLLTRHTLFVGLSMLDDNLLRIAHRVAQVRPPEAGELGTTLALRDDPTKAELWAGVFEQVAVSPAGTSTDAAARGLELLLDTVGLHATPPVGYLLDPAYRGMLGPGERRLAERLADLPDDAVAGTPAWPAVAGLLRTLGGRP